MKHKNRYEVFQVLPMYNVHPYFSLKNLGKNVRFICSKIQYVLEWLFWTHVC